jgi:hypothetical protein
VHHASHLSRTPSCACMVRRPPGPCVRASLAVYLAPHALLWLCTPMHCAGAHPRPSRLAPMPLCTPPPPRLRCHHTTSAYICWAPRARSNPPRVPRQPRPTRQAIPNLRPHPTVAELILVPSPSRGARPATAAQASTAAAQASTAATVCPTSRPCALCKRLFPSRPVPALQPSYVPA